MIWRARDDDELRRLHHEVLDQARSSPTRNAGHPRDGISENDTNLLGTMGCALAIMSCRASEPCLTNTSLASLQPFG